MNDAYLLTGGNMDDRERLLREACRLIEGECGTVAQVSGLYETEAWGKTDQPLFLNQAIHLKTDLNARQLLRRLLKIEKQMGRTRKEKYGPRLIDIDILFFNNEIHNYPLLKLPHPEIQNRRFALLPLNEIAPALLHPVFNKTVSALLQECRDILDVRKLE